MNFKRYLMKAGSDNEHDTGDLDFAVTEFSKELFDQIAEARSLFRSREKRLKNLSSITIREYSTYFLSFAAVEAMLPGDLFEDVQNFEYGDAFKLPDTAIPDRDKFNVQLSEEMVVVATGVWWNTNPKHSSITVGSGHLAWEWFSQCSNCGLRHDEHARGKCLFTSTRYAAQAPSLVRRSQNRRKRT